MKQILLLHSFGEHTSVPPIVYLMLHVPVCTQSLKKIYEELLKELLHKLFSLQCEKIPIVTFHKDVIMSELEMAVSKAYQIPPQNLSVT